MFQLLSQFSDFAKIQLTRHVLVLVSTDRHIPWTSSPLTEWLSHGSPLALLPSTLLSLSPCVSCPERDSEAHCVSEMFINERGAHTESRAAIEGLIANLFINTVNLPMH